MELLDWSAARLFWDVIQALIMALIGVYLWWTNRTRATTDAFRKLEQRIGGVDKAVAHLEQTVNHQPGYGDIDKLRGDLAQTNRSLAEVSAQLQGTTALLHRLHDYLLQERRGS